MKFPQFRKYKNNLSFFKVISETRLTEYKTIGSKIEEFNFVAKILPDRNYIYDMLYDYENHWDKINEAEFESFIEKYMTK
jgi:hypothetical protein